MSQGPNEIPAGTQCRAASLLHPQHLAASLPINPPPPHFPTHLLTDVLQAGGDHFKLSFHGKTCKTGILPQPTGSFNSKLAQI